MGNAFYGQRNMIQNPNPLRVVVGGGADADPFLIHGPAVISFSGGRTSAYMLHRILQAHGGALPTDVVVCFANTGREMPATLDFVRDCGAAWNVPIVWLEYRRDAETDAKWTEIVSHNSASRNGEPFEAMLLAHSTLPNPRQSFCTIELKIRQMVIYCQQHLGWKHWTNIIGLRRDESERYDGAMKRNASNKERFKAACPLYDAGIEEHDVLRFWRAQPFDLMLKGPHEGNCDGCFKKGLGALSLMFTDHPERMAWWLAQEAQPRGAGVGNRFRLERTMASVKRRAPDIAASIRNQRWLDGLDDPDALSCADAACGV